MRADTSRSPRLTRFIGVLWALLALDLALIVMSGGVSIFGTVTAFGFFSRWGLALALLAAGRFRGEPAGLRRRGYLALLLFFLPFLHYLGYRLRGDGLWYYSYAHSLAFDRDLDLTNQYQRLGIDHYPGSQPVRETGLPRNTFPVGVGILWIPFLYLGHLGAWLRNAHGFSTAYDGWSDPYLHTLALGNTVLGWLGLLVLDRFLSRWFTPSLAFAATVGLACGSFLFWYLALQPIYTHAPTFFLATVVVERWAKNSPPPRLASMGWTGLLIGWAACLRWQNGLLGFLPLSRLGGDLRREPRRSALAAAALAVGFFLGVLPQLLAWKLLFGRFLIGVPLGADYVRWSDPFLAETLFSSRHGLFSWSPLLLFAAAGFVGFWWRHPRPGWPLALLLVGFTYVNSAVADWWGGGSFGARRFDSALPILALGLATALGGLVAASRRRPGLLAAGLLAVFILTNVLFSEQYRKGRLPPDDTISFEAAARGMIEDVFDGVGYPFAFPANWLFAARYDRPKTQYDLLVGKYLFHRQNNLGGVIDLGPSDPPFIGNGWSSLADWEGRQREVRLALGPTAGVFVPTDRPERLRVVVVCAAPSGGEPRSVELRLNGQPVTVFRPSSEMAEHGGIADARWWRRLNLLEFVPAEPGPAPFLVVDRIRFERVEPGQ
jgi:hypothetical protein